VQGKSFLTALEDEALMEEWTAEKLGKSAPCAISFMPTKRIFQKLIRRATQIKDPIAELNPAEAMHDNRKKLKEEGEASEEIVTPTITVKLINDKVVHAGVDDKFNALRVFPPELNYPDV